MSATKIKPHHCLSMSILLQWWIQVWCPLQCIMNNIETWKKLTGFDEFAMFPVNMLACKHDIVTKRNSFANTIHCVFDTCCWDGVKLDLFNQLFNCDYNYNCHWGWWARLAPRFAWRSGKNPSFLSEAYCLPTRRAARPNNVGQDQMWLGSATAHQIRKKMPLLLQQWLLPFISWYLLDI